MKIEDAIKVLQAGADNNYAFLAIVKAFSMEPVYGMNGRIEDDFLAWDCPEKEDPEALHSLNVYKIKLKDVESISCVSAHRAVHYLNVLSSLLSRTRNALQNIAG